MKAVQKKKRHIRKAILVPLIFILCVILGTGGFYGVKGYRMYREAIEERSIADRVEEIRGAENFVSYSELPEFYIDATISVEDHRFKKHWGIDIMAVGRAAWTDLKAMSFVEGGSTITQQIVKNMLFTQEKKMERKAAEVFAVLELESKYTKEEIFELYVNNTDFGSGYRGIYQAAMGYFGKEPLQLTDYESAMLAGIPNAPSVYSPDISKELAYHRVQKVLESMVDNQVITQKQADEIEQDAEEQSKEEENNE
ncbi:MAG: transglycosylase domain-containing protein [Dorea sp.]|jgi:membrane peptidoglycan carboxypeptidase|nr:transglycosylase domain-containing protein [Dorea sp.]